MTRGAKGQAGEHYKKEKAKMQHELAGPLTTASRRTTLPSTPRGGGINFKGKTAEEKGTTTRVIRGGLPTTKTTNGVPKAARRTTRQHLPARQTRPEYLAEALEATQ